MSSNSDNFSSRNNCEKHSDGITNTVGITENDVNNEISSNRIYFHGDCRNNDSHGDDSQDVNKGSGRDTKDTPKFDIEADSNGERKESSDFHSGNSVTPIRYTTLSGDSNSVGDINSGGDSNNGDINSGGDINRDLYMNSGDDINSGDINRDGDISSGNINGNGKIGDVDIGDGCNTSSLKIDLNRCEDEEETCVDYHVNDSTEDKITEAGSPFSDFFHVISDCCSTNAVEVAVAPSNTSQTNCGDEEGATVIGIMHAAVLSGDEKRVQKLMEKCEVGKLDFQLINSKDEQGYTPLHHACMQRLTKMVTVLHKATANDVIDVTVADSNGWTPLHWAAMHLDDHALNLLRNNTIDLDLEDKQQRTPLYMACVEGRDIRGLTEPLILSRCLSSMLLHHPNVNLVDWKGFSLLHYLCASWQHEPAELLIKEGASVHTVYVPMSVGSTTAKVTTATTTAAEDASKSGQRRCRGMNALHFAAAALPLKAAVGLGRSTLRGGGGNSSSNSSDNNSSSGSNNTATDQQQQFQPEPLNKPHGIDTLRLLLKAGARPNSKDSKGRTALVIIAEAYLADIAFSTTTAGTAATAVVSMRWNAAEVVDALSLLTSFGARWDENSPQLSLLKQQLPQLNVAALWDKWSSLPAVNGDDLNIGLNHFKVDDNNLLGSQLTASADDGCLLCSFKFTLYTLFKRKHRCCICDVVCCDGCSKKRCIIKNSKVRCCDSCFNQLAALQECNPQSDAFDNTRPLTKDDDQIATREQQQQERDMLLGGSSNGNKSGSDSSSSVAQSMCETRQQLELRGQQIEQIDLRSRQLADQAGEYERTARQLKEQLQKRWI